jgi:hypothetical protein
MKTNIRFTAYAGSEPSPHKGMFRSSKIIFRQPGLWKSELAANLVPSSPKTFHRAAGPW